MAAMTARPELQHPGVRRSATVPSKLLPTAFPTYTEDPSSEEASGEDLFTHPAARIVSFNAPSMRAMGTEVGTLPWMSRAERVVAFGSMRIYRPKGSVAFLQSGSLLLSLLPRSQCWCVDGESKFAMRVQQLIYRIELPYSNADERAKVEDLKEVLKKVLQYETTACPFKRGFTVELPASEPESLRRMRLIGPYTKAKPWELDDLWQRRSMQGPFRGVGSPDGSDEDGARTPVEQQALVGDPLSEQATALVEDEDGTTPDSIRADTAMPPTPLDSSLGNGSQIHLYPLDVERQRSITAPAVLLAPEEPETDSSPDNASSETSEEDMENESISQARHEALATAQTAPLPPALVDTAPSLMNVEPESAPREPSDSSILLQPPTPHNRPIPHAPAGLPQHQPPSPEITLPDPPTALPATEYPPTDITDPETSCRNSSLHPSTIALLSNLQHPENPLTSFPQAPPTPPSPPVTTAPTNTNNSKPLRRTRTTPSHPQKPAAQPSLLTRIINILLSPPGDFLAMLREFLSRLLTAAAALARAYMQRQTQGQTRTRRVPMAHGARTGSSSSAREERVSNRRRPPGGWISDADDSNDDDSDTSQDSADDDSSLSDFESEDAAIRGNGTAFRAAASKHNNVDDDDDDDEEHDFGVPFTSPVRKRQNQKENGQGWTSGADASASASITSIARDRDRGHRPAVESGTDDDMEVEVESVTEKPPDHERETLHDFD